MAKKKNPWTYRKRKKTKKTKNKAQESEAELAESSTLPDPDGETVPMELSSDVPLNEAPLKNEVDYPDIRFQSSTTLFPAKEIEDGHLPSEGPSNISKRTVDKEWLSNSSKKLKVNNGSTETIDPTIDDEVEEVAATPKKVKIEVIDLTDESQPIGPILCSPVKTSHLPNRLPGKPNAAQNVSPKVKSNEKTSEDAIEATNKNYHTNLTKSEPDNASVSTSHVNNDRSPVGTNESVNFPMDNLSNIGVKHEKNSANESVNINVVVQSPIVPPCNEENVSNESENNINVNQSSVVSPSVNIPLNNLSNIGIKLEKNTVNQSVNINAVQSPIVPPCNENNVSNDIENTINVDQSSVVPPSHVNIQIKTEQNKSNECQNEVDSINPQNKSSECQNEVNSINPQNKSNGCRNGVDSEDLHRAVLRNLDQMILELRSNSGNEKENRQITDQVPSSNSVLAPITKDASDALTCFNYLPSAVHIKVEKDENCSVNENSTSVSNSITGDVSSVDRNVENNQDKTSESCDNYLHASRPPSVCSTEIPSVTLGASARLTPEHLPNIINTQQTVLELRSSSNNENRQITDQVPSSNTVSVPITKDASDALTFNYLPSAVHIKVEQNENCSVSENSTSVSNSITAAISSIDRSVENNRNKTSESSDNYLHISRPPSVCSTEIPSVTLGASARLTPEHLLNVINTQQTVLELRSSSNNENRQITDQVPSSNTVSVPITKDALTFNYLPSSVHIKVEQNENCSVDENSTSVSNSITAAISSIDRSVENNRNKTPESSDNYLHISRPPSVCSTEIPSVTLGASARLTPDHLPNVINTQQTILELRSSSSNENRQITDQVPSSSTVSVPITKDASDTLTFNYLPSAVHIKVEPNENCSVSENSTSVSNSITAAISSIDRNVENNQNKTSESSENYLHVSRPPSVCSTEIPSVTLSASSRLVTEHLPNVINTQQTKGTSNDLIAHDSTNNIGQKIVVKEENESEINQLNCLSAVAQVRNEVESMDCEENSCTYLESQNGGDLSQRSAKSKIENAGVVSTEELISDHFNQISISPDSDEEVFCDSNSQRFKAGTFQTPLLKYLNCNKVDAFQVSRGRSFLESLLKERDTTNIESEVIPIFTDSPNKLKANFAEKGEESSNFQASERESISLNVDEILNKISWAKLQNVLNLNPNVTNLGSSSSQLDHEQRNNSSPNRFFEPPSNISECSQLSHSDSQSVYFDSPMDIESPLDNQSVVSHSSFDGNKQVELSKDQSTEGKKIDTKLFSNEYLKKILGTVNATGNFNSIASTSSSLSLDPRKESLGISNSFGNSDDTASSSSIPSLDPRMKKLGTSNSFGNSDGTASTSSSPSLDPRNKIHGTSNSIGNTDNIASTSSSPFLDPRNKSNITIDESLYESLRQINLFKNNLVKDMNSVSNVDKKNSGSMKNSEIFPKNVALPSDGVNKRSGDVVFNSSASCSNVEVPSKRVKMSEGASNSKSHGPKRLSLDEYKKRDLPFPSESPSNSSNRFSTDFEQNMFPSANRQNRNLPITPDSSLQNPGYRPVANTGYIQDPRLARNSSRSLYNDVNSQQLSRPSNTSQTYPLQSVPEPSSVHPSVNQRPSIPAFNSMRNSSHSPSGSELFRHAVNTVKNQQVNRSVSELGSIHPPNVHPRASERDRRGFMSPPSSDSSSFSMSPNMYDHSVPGMTDRQPLISYPHFQDNTSSVTHHHFSSRSREPVLNPPLPKSAPPLPPPLPSAPPIPSTSSSSHHHSSKRLTASKSGSNRNQTSSVFSFVSLLSRQLTEGIGKVLISSNEIYLIIIEKNIDWILAIDKEAGVPRLSEIGGNFHQVRDSYQDHLIYYNTYFPLLLLDCFSKVSGALKGAKEKEKANRNICKVVNFENRQGYVSVMCESFIDQSDVENIPKDGHIILAKFSTIPTGNVKLLGYVCSSCTRAYSHKHDHGHEILRFSSTARRSDLLKIKITFFIAFALSGINTDAPVQVTKLINIKKALNLNNALRELKGSPLCDTVLSPWSHKIKNVDLPRRQDTSAMTSVVQDIVQTLDPSSPRLTVVKSAPFADSFLAIVQLVEEMQKFRIPGKALVCVRSEVLNQMGLNLIETSCNVVIINRERENLHGRLQSKILDVMASHYVKALDITEEKAKLRVLQETDVLLVVTGSCYYEDVKSMARDINYCIIHDAHSFPEPESLLPLLYGIKHLLLFGDPDEQCHVSSKGAAVWGYSKSLFHRIYNLC